jgi:hypothetical protein
MPWRHHIRHRKKTPHDRIPPGYKVFREKIAMLLCLIDIIFIVCELKKINMSLAKKNISKNRKLIVLRSEGVCLTNLHSWWPHKRMQLFGPSFQLGLKFFTYVGTYLGIHFLPTYVGVELRFTHFITCARSFITKSFRNSF